VLFLSKSFRSGLQIVEGVEKLFVVFRASQNAVPGPGTAWLCRGDQNTVPGPTWSCQAAQNAIPRPTWHCQGGPSWFFSKRCSRTYLALPRPKRRFRANLELSNSPKRRFKAVETLDSAELIRISAMHQNCSVFKRNRRWISMGARQCIYTYIYICI